MLVTFFCDHCDAKLRINADGMGSHLVCPECEKELIVPHMRLGPGFVVGGFLIKHKIGEGGMGEVYLATQLSLERDVALKILPSRFTRERSFVVRFLKEVHYQARLDHPNVVAAFDAGEDGGVYYMAMAYVEGETLEERLEREGPMSEPDALMVIRQVALALQYACEEKGLLHRDIKPANIMVTPTLHAKVLDMGLSKNTFDKNSSTQADTLLGTPNYMSPEQIDHPQDLDTRSDMFSLGMALYHMITGQVPYEDTSYLKTLKRHAAEKLEDPRALMPGIHRGTACFLARLLARDPDDRYADWDDLLEDLRHVMGRTRVPSPPEGESSLEVQADPEPPASAPPQPVPAAPASRDRRTARGVALSVTAGLGLGAAGVWGLAMLMPRESAPEPETVRTSADPTPAPLPAPTAEPTPAFNGYQKELARLILAYEREPGDYDQVLPALLDLGTRASGTPVAEEAALQIVRIRRDRDRAVDAERTRIREETIRRLYDEGAEAARSFLDGLEGPFVAELEGAIGNLRRRIRIWEQQEQDQREAEKAAARSELERLQRELVPVILRSEWPKAVSLLDEAAREPAFFPVAEELADLRAEVIALQEVPTRILDSYQQLEGRAVSLELQDRTLLAEIREVEPDGLLVGRTVLAEDGLPRGTVEQFIPFSQLSASEILRQLENLEGPEVVITRAMLAQRNGRSDTCREQLESAGTPLARAIANHLFALPTLPEFMPAPATPEPEASPSGRRPFAPLPTIGDE